LEVPVQARYWNWRLWAGFACALAALLIYFVFFVMTRAVFWPCLTLFLVAVLLLISGMQRAFAEPQTYRGKIAGPILSGLSLLVITAFGLVSYQVSKAFPAAKNAPRVGQLAPEFTLADSNGKNVSLAKLLASPVADGSGSTHASKGLLVVFYRGYW
jgi:hypothetical protein